MTLGDFSDVDCHCSFLSESCAQVCLCHWLDHLRWSFHSWNLHQSDSGCFQGAPPPDRDWSSRWPPAADWGLLRQHPNHCPLQHRLPTEIRRHCHPMQQQSMYEKPLLIYMLCLFCVKLKQQSMWLAMPSSWVRLPGESNPCFLNAYYRSYCEHFIQGSIPRQSKRWKVYPKCNAIRFR